MISVHGETTDAGSRGETGSGRSIAIGAGNASLGYPVTKQVRLARNKGPSRHIGLSPLKMVQPKPHCSDAAALERDTCTPRRTARHIENRKRIPCVVPRCRRFIVDLGDIDDFILVYTCDSIRFTLT